MNFAQQQADPRRRIVGFGAVLLFHALWSYAPRHRPRQEGRRGGPGADRDQGHRGGEEAAAAARGRRAAAAEAGGAAAAVHPAARDPGRRRRRRRQPTITATTPTPPPAPVVSRRRRRRWSRRRRHRRHRRRPPRRPSCQRRCRLLELHDGDGRRRLPAGGDSRRHRAGRSDDPVHAPASGEIKDIKALRASNPIFARNSIRIVGQYKCQGQGRDVLVTVPFGYKLE